MAAGRTPPIADALARARRAHPDACRARRRQAAQPPDASCSDSQLLALFGSKPPLVRSCAPAELHPCRRSRPHVATLADDEISAPAPHATSSSVEPGVGGRDGSGDTGAAARRDPQSEDDAPQQQAVAGRGQAGPCSRCSGGDADKVLSCRICYDGFLSPRRAGGGNPWRPLSPPPSKTPTVVASGTRPVLASMSTHSAPLPCGRPELPLCLQVTLNAG
eukprot:SM000107S14100  [mRNA]  locus=s107:434605:436146:- [translate_table: standard]